MEASSTFQGPQRVPLRALSAFIALATVFLLGSAGGYGFKALTTPAAPVITHYITVPAPTPKQTILPNQA